MPYFAFFRSALDPVCEPDNVVKRTVNKYININTHTHTHTYIYIYKSTETNQNEISFI